MIPLSSILIFAAILFCLSLLGLIINRKNIINMLMSIELLLLSVNTNFIAFAHHLHNIAGEIFVFFILTVAAAEAAIGLAIMIVLFRKRETIAVSELNELKG
ncbi:MAG: NADH-quinone oxidoreductase subunit NuoK [Pseudomonadota bacterium]